MHERKAEPLRDVPCTGLARFATPIGRNQFSVRGLTAAQGCPRWRANLAQVDRRAPPLQRTGRVRMRSPRRPASEAFNVYNGGRQTDLRGMTGHSARKSNHGFRESHRHDHGAAGHLGRAVVARFEQAGAHLALIDRQADSLEAAFGSATEHEIVAADLLDISQLQSALATAVQRFRRIDVLCHLAGGFRMGQTVHETTDRTWDLLFDINARTLVNVARVVVPHMIEKGGARSSTSLPLPR
jgi:hypothetical protein